MTHKHWMILGAVVVIYFMYSNGSLAGLLGAKPATPTA